MATKAYVLIDTAVGKGIDVAETLQKIPGMVAVDRVTGPHDVIAVFEAADLNEVGDLVTARIHTINGILRTVTCLSVNPR